MEINLEGKRIVIVLSEYEAILARKAWPLVHPQIEFFLRVILRLTFHLLSTDKKTFREGVARVNEGEDPEEVFEFGEIYQRLLNDPALKTLLDEAVSLEEIAQMLPEGEVDEE